MTLGRISNSRFLLPLTLIAAFSAGRAMAQEDIDGTDDRGGQFDVQAPVVDDGSEWSDERDAGEEIPELPNSPDLPSDDIRFDGEVIIQPVKDCRSCQVAAPGTDKAQVGTAVAVEAAQSEPAPSRSEGGRRNGDHDGQVDVTIIRIAWCIALSGLGHRRELRGPVVLARTSEPHLRLGSPSPMVKDGAGGSGSLQGGDRSDVRCDMSIYTRLISAARADALALPAATESILREVEPPRGSR